MASTILDRVATVVGSTPVSVAGYGFIQCSNVAGTDAITADTSPEITSYVTNAVYLLRPHASNAGAVTVNLNGLGAKSLKTPAGGAIAAGDLTPNIEYLIKYDGTDFYVLSTF
jgi:hypothetical protein